MGSAISIVLSIISICVIAYQYKTIDRLELEIKLLKDVIKKTRDED